jgi:hypothetical protein
MSVTDSVISGEMKDMKDMKYLPGKYAKFVNFTYWLLKQAEYEDNSGEFTAAISKIRDFARVFSVDIPAQVEFVERFFTVERDIAKMLKADIKNMKSEKKEKKEPKEKNQRSEEEDLVPDKKGRGESGVSKIFTEVGVMLINEIMTVVVLGLAVDQEKMTNM